MSEEVTKMWLQHEVYELLNNKHGIVAENPKIVIGLRGEDLIVFATNGQQFVILFEEAIEPR